MVVAQDTKYYARVKTDLLDEWGTLVKSFTTGTVVSTAYITSPKNGGSGVPTSVNVTSNLVQGAKFYTIELNTASNFLGESIVQTAAKRTIAFAGLREGTTYYGRVKTDVSSDQWGPTSNFTTTSPLARSTSDWMGEEDDEEIFFEPWKAEVYPIPFSHTLKIHVQSQDETVMQVVLFDLTGREVYRMQGKTNRVDELPGDHLAQGIYLLRILSDQGTTTIKVIKE